MNQDPRTMTQRVHAVLQTATAMLDLPLDKHHLKALALHLAPVAQAWCAEARDAATTDTPVPYSVTTVDEQAGVETTEYAGCVRRIAVDVDHDSPAATLAAELSRHHDVVVTEVPTPTYLGLTVRPQSLKAWHWWLEKVAASADVTVQDADAYATGSRDGVVVQLCGDGVGALIASEATARLGWDADYDTPAGTIATKARRQPDVIAVEIRDAHTIALTIRPKSLVEWQWWLHLFSVEPHGVTFEGTTAVATGSKGGATVHLHGDDARALYDDQAAARLVGLIAPATRP